MEREEEREGENNPNLPDSTICMLYYYDFLLE